MADKTDPECEFCKIVLGQAVADLVYENDETLAFAPLEPAVKGHTLVVPKTHVADFTSAEDKLLCELIRTTRLVARGIRSSLKPDGFNVITSAGEAATQTVFHLHIHVVPRWGHDRMGKIWPPPSPYLEETKDDVALLIRQAIDDLGHDSTNQ